MDRPIITLLTDFGLRDHYVAAMKGVLLGICPEACLVDISHQIEPFAIQQGAWTLSQAWRYFPPETVHLVVVDPGVGSERRPIAVASCRHVFVGPDNGVLSTAFSADPAHKVFEITASGYFRKPVSATFHGRDIFAPVAAHLATGLSIATVGRPLENPVQLMDLKPMAAGPGCWTGVIVNIDRFGNVVTNFDWDRFHWVAKGPFELTIGSRPVTLYRQNYSQAAPDEYFVTPGSAGFLEVSSSGADAARSLGVQIGSHVKLIA